MKSLQIEESTAKKLFQKASPEFKELLIENFGKEFFSEKVTDRIKSFEDACAELGMDPKSILNNSDTKDEAAYKKLKVIVKALNEGWEPDWYDSNQRKYFPWFEFVSGSGFRCNDFDIWTAHTTVGSRLCFKTSELAVYAGKQFKSIYSDFITI